MKKEGYDAETAAAITAASATIGPIIPPSLPMVIYGVSADVSIGGLFLAGIIPGLLMAGALCRPRHGRGDEAQPAPPPVPGRPRRLGGLQARALGADDAGHPLRRHDGRHHDADRGGRRGHRLRALPRPRHLPRLRPARAAEAHRRDGRDERHRSRPGDDGGGARLVPVDRARAADADPADRRAHRQPAPLPSRGQRAAASSSAASWRRWRRC